MTDADARIDATLKALDTPAYYAGAFGAFVEEVKDIRETFERCGAFAFRQEQWRMLVRDYECAYKACVALSAECARLRGLLHEAGHSFQDHWAINWEPIIEVMAEVDAEKEKEQA